MQCFSNPDKPGRSFAGVIMSTLESGVGYNVILWCACPPENEGNPPSKLRWSRLGDGENITHNEGLLTFWNVNLTEIEGEYACLAYNNVGAGEETVVKIQFPKEIESVDGTYKSTIALSVIVGLLVVGLCICLVVMFLLWRRYSSQVSLLTQVCIEVNKTVYIFIIDSGKHGS